MKQKIQKLVKHTFHPSPRLPLLPSIIRLYACAQMYTQRIDGDSVKSILSLC